jgi:phage RecT family recombinase
MSQELQVSEKTVLPYLAPRVHEIIRLIGEDNYTRETSFAIQAVNAIPYLSKASPMSVAKAIFNVAITGLSLNPVLKLAYITPRSINGQVEAVLMPSYVGLVKLLTDTGSVIKVDARCVYKGDIFEVNYGTETKLIHKPSFNNKKENITHFYAIGTLSDGSTQFDVMTIDEVNIIRDKSDGYRAFKNGKASSAIWEDHYSEMGRKTIVKRLAKYLPKSAHSDKWEKAMTAIDLDNKDYPMDLNQENYLMMLMENSTLDERRRGFIQQRIESGISKDEAEKIIEDLKLNQLQPADRPQLSATDAKEATRIAIN